MAEKKEVIIKVKVNTTETINADISKNLDEMLKLSAGKLTAGKAKLKIENKDGVMIKDEHQLTGELSDQHKVLAGKIHEQAHATMKGIANGKISVEFKTEIKI